MEPVGTLDNKAYKKQDYNIIQRFSSSWRLQSVLKMMSVVGATHRPYLKPPRSSRKKQKLQYVTGRPTRQETQTSAQTKKALNPPRRHDTSRCRASASSAQHQSRHQARLPGNFDLSFSVQRNTEAARLLQQTFVTHDN